MTANTFSIKVTYRSRTYDVVLPSPSPTLLEIGTAIASATGTDLTTVKLLASSVKGGVVPVARASESAAEAGLQSGCKVMLLASSVEDVQGVRSAKDLAGLAGFDHELRTAARRRRQTGGAVELPKGDFTFKGYESWQRPGLLPAPPEALKLLHRLAADPGISSVMEQHRYKVGLLSEMPPEGKVGISPVCVLGVNINAGQEISLRLRTDDLRGFRKYEKIRETLIHELAHMEWSEHDTNFKSLNSQLTREVSAVLDRYRGGNSAWALLGITEDNASDSRVTHEMDGIVFEDEGVMAATARSSGKSLRTLAGQPASAATAARLGSGGSSSSSNPRAAAAEAALLRLSGVGVSTTTPAPTKAPGLRSAAATCPSVPVSSGDDTAPEEEQGREFEREDASTAAAEAAMQLLGDEGSPCATAATATAAVANAAASHSTDATHPLSSEARSSTRMEVDNPAVVSPVQQEAAAAGSGLPVAASRLLLPVQSDAVAAPGGVVMPDTQPAAATLPTATPAAVLDFTSLMSSTRVELDPTMVPASSDSDTAHNDSPHREGMATDTAAQQQGSDAHTKRHAGAVITPAPTQQHVSPEMERRNGGDVATIKLRQAWQGLQACVGVSGSAAEAVVALQVLQTLLGNLARAPGESRYKTIKLENPALQRKVGVGLEAVVEVLKVAGFVQAGGLLQWRRNDVGLVWLVHSAVQAAVEQVHAKVRSLAVTH
ncbi:MAG: hypothetical protein WDW38_008904 [Sanguina aurantia]